MGIPDGEGGWVIRICLGKNVDVVIASIIPLKIVFLVALVEAEPRLDHSLTWRATTQPREEVLVGFLYRRELEPPGPGESPALADLI